MIEPNTPAEAPGQTFDCQQERVPGVGSSRLGCTFIRENYLYHFPAALE